VQDSGLSTFEGEYLGQALLPLAPLIEQALSPSLPGPGREGKTGGRTGKVEGWIPVGVFNSLQYQGKEGWRTGRRKLWMRLTFDFLSCVSFVSHFAFLSFFPPLPPSLPQLLFVKKQEKCIKKQSSSSSSSSSNKKPSVLHSPTKEGREEDEAEDQAENGEGIREAHSTRHLNPPFLRRPWPSMCGHRLSENGGTSEGKGGGKNEEFFRCVARYTTIFLITRPFPPSLLPSSPPPLPSSIADRIPPTSSSSSSSSSLPRRPPPTQAEVEESNVMEAMLEQGGM